MAEAHALSRTMADRERRGIGTATPERMARGDEAFEERETDIGRAQILTPAPLDRLYRCGGLGRDEDAAKRRLDAGEKFYRCWYYGSLVPLASRDYRKPYTGAGDGFAIMPATERQAMHRSAYRAALRALRGGYAIFEDRISRATRLIVLEELPIAEVGRIVTERNHEAQARAVATEMLIDGLDRLIRHWSVR